MITERYGLPEDVKPKVKELDRLNVKPSAIMEKLRQLGMIYKTDQIVSKWRKSILNARFDGMGKKP